MRSEIEPTGYELWERRVDALAAIRNGEVIYSQWRDPWKGTKHIFHAAKASITLNNEDHWRVTRLEPVATWMAREINNKIDNDPVPVRLYLRSPNA